ncbi:MAG: putative N-acetylmuramoyl-L-alanine amidase [Prokaryotic dsDNA virus sp.]|nr:MAG: putative N-acetylmuramoyl-L-alanine amidase [Prokaryotic dsDNA virus sp.]|tara:strand:- start:5367 stop:6533 length:1167 start_codon:yes stop_codon:yes gene_type:complete
MKSNAIHYYCLVDKSDRSWERRLESFKKEMLRTHSCKFTVEEFDARSIDWTPRRERLYASDDYVFSHTKGLSKKFGTDIDAVKFFVSDDNWEQGKYRLKGFKLGRVFNGYYVTFTRLRYAKDTGEHEALHFVDDYVKYNTGVSLAAVMKVQDWDDEVVHSPIYWKKQRYNYDGVWEKVAPFVEDAVFQRRQKTLQNKIAQLQLIIRLLTQLLGLQKYNSHTVYEVEIRRHHTSKCYNIPLKSENAIIGHIDLGTEKGTINEILNGSRSASYHWYIPRHAKYVIEFVPKEKSAWHAGTLSNPESGLAPLLGGPNEIIESGEPNNYSYGICYEGLNTWDEANDDQIDLAVQLMHMKKIQELPVIAHYQVTDYKPRIVESFVTGIKSLLSK